MSETFIHLVVALVVILDPFGNIPYFLAWTAGFDSKTRSIIISKAILFAFFILLVFVIFGGYILSYLNLSINSFKVAGGLLLLFIAFQIIFGIPKLEKETPIALTPLGTPLLAGPGAIATVIIYSAFASPFQKLTAVLAIVLALSLTWLILISSEYLFKILKKEGTLALAKIMGLILAALAVEMVFSGIGAVNS